MPPFWNELILATTTLGSIENAPFIELRLVAEIVISLFLSSIEVFALLLPLATIVGAGITNTRLFLAAFCFAKSTFCLSASEPYEIFP